MGKIKKVRRIDFSHEELEENLNLTKNAVNKRLDAVCDFYGFDKENFKVGMENGRYFFPVEYTGLLEILLDTIPDNPAAKKRAKEKVSAEDVVLYNSKLIKLIRESEHIPSSYKKALQDTPAYQTAEKIINNLLVLVDEIHLLLHTLFSAPGRDLGETIKLMNRKLDEVNYNLFANQLRDNYMGFANKNSAALDIMLDESIARTIKQMMKRTNLSERQKEECETLADDDKEYLALEKRKDLEDTISKEFPKYSRREIIKEADRNERIMYFEKYDDVLGFMAEPPRRMCSIKVQTGKVWETRHDRIKKGVFKIDTKEEYMKSSYKCSYDDYMRMMGVNFVLDKELKTPEKYVQYVEKILKTESEIHERISQRIAFDIIERFVHNKDAGQ